MPSFRFEEQSTRRIAVTVRKSESEPTPLAHRRVSRVHSNPPVLWLCKTTGVLAQGSQGLVDILEGPVGSESQLNGSEQLNAKNTFEADIPADTKIWVAAGRVFGNASNDKWYVISVDRSSAAVGQALNVAVLSGNRIGTGLLSLSTLKSTGGISSTGTSITFTEDGWYLLTYNMLISSFDKTANGAGNRADVIYGSLASTHFLLDDVPFAQDKNTSLFTGLGGVAIDPINPSIFTSEADGFSGAQLAPRFVTPSDSISLEVLTDGNHQFVAEVSVAQIRKQP